MATEAQSEDLLYVGGNSGDVTVYSYPQGKLVGTLRNRNFFLPAGECVDKAGDVFITDNGSNKIFEYRHGGKRPVRTLPSAADDPNGCAIDPTTGNLAVSSLGRFSQGNLAIYPHARGTPKSYTDPDIYGYFFCGYDPQGNLYVDGQGHNPKPFHLAELAKGSATLKTIKLNQKVDFPGGVQWDGTNLAVGDQATSTIYQFAISGRSGTLAGSTALNDGGDVLQFWIVGGRVIGGNTGQNLEHYWQYPAGGNPTKTIRRGIGGPIGVTVSTAPK